MNYPYYSRDLKNVRINPWRRRAVTIGLFLLYTWLISEWATW